MKRCCRYCEHLFVPTTPSGRRVVYRERIYTCKAEIADVALPWSVTSAYQFEWPPRKTPVQPDDGEGCNTFVERKKEVK